MLLSSKTGHSGRIKLIIEGILRIFTVGFPIINAVPTTRVSLLLINRFLPVPTLRNDTISLNAHFAYPPDNLNSEIVAKITINIMLKAIILYIN